MYLRFRSQLKKTHSVMLNDVNQSTSGQHSAPNARPNGCAWQTDAQGGCKEHPLKASDYATTDVAWQDTTPLHLADRASAAVGRRQLMLASAHSTRVTPLANLKVCRQKEDGKDQCRCCPGGVCG